MGKLMLRCFVYFYFCVAVAWWIHIIFTCIYFQISGRLFSDSGPRRSTRLAGEAGGNTSATSTASTGNGISHSTKYMGSSRLSNAGLRSVTIRKGQGWASESFEEGDCLILLNFEFDQWT